MKKTREAIQILEDCLRETNREQIYISRETVEDIIKLLED